MNILVTGAAGFVGSHLVPELQKKHAVLALDKIYDVTEELDIPNVDLIINLASVNSSKEGIEKPFDYFFTNVLGQVRLLEKARKMGAKFMYLTSVKEAELNPYGLSKLCAHMYCQMYRKVYNMPIVVNRVGNLYGSGGDQFFVNQFVQKVMNGKKVTVYGTGNERRTILHIDDLVKLLTKQVNNFENYLIEPLWKVSGGPQNSLTVNELLNYLEATKIDYQAGVPGQENTLVEDSTVLGWQPEIDWKSGVDQLVKEYASVHV